MTLSNLLQTLNPAKRRPTRRAFISVVLLKLRNYMQFDLFVPLLFFVTP